MHAGAFNFVRRTVETLPPRKEVVEYGGRIINGTVRTLFDCPYTSVDLVAGTGVDMVGDAVLFQPQRQPDTVVCCEVLEHSARWVDIIKAAGRILHPLSGVLILTCATHPRAPHSSIDGGYVREFEYYGNVDPMDLSRAFDAAGFEDYDLEVETLLGDIYAVARKKAPSGT